MPRKARVKSKTNIYHVMWRGANGQEIFHDDEDSIKFLDTINKYTQRLGMKIFAWCLMTNHAHLLMKEGTEDISITMKRIGVSFVSYYNWKYRITGHLYQDRFKSENVETTKYLLTVTRYIHQNPVKAGLTKKAHEWKWSSCNGYYGESIYPENMLDDTFILKMFSNEIATVREVFKKFNETRNNDQCLDIETSGRKKLTDEEARIQIKELLGAIEIPQVKSLPRLKRDEVLRQVKQIKGLSQRQAARILGISSNLIFKA
ncbi:transposase [Bacillus sp. DJP31]|uniref:transposase n=1 Tax=Bacillus sp. DJP31 TaxID=3409789 RepID=UPI003BB7B445